MLTLLDEPFIQPIEPPVASVEMPKDPETLVMLIIPLEFFGNCLEYVIRLREAVSVANSELLPCSQML